MALAGSHPLTKSKVANRTADLDVFDRQKIPAPVYIGRIPSFLSVPERIDDGDLLVANELDSCCLVLIYSVGYYEKVSFKVKDIVLRTDRYQSFCSSCRTPCQ